MEVDAYVDDALCGRTFTSGFFVDLFGGIQRINDRKQVARVRRDLPILLIAGDKDPVGDGEGPRAVAEQYSSVGVVDVTCTLYPGARHEIFNETNRDEASRRTSSPGWTPTCPERGAGSLPREPMESDTGGIRGRLRAPPPAPIREDRPDACVASPDTTGSPPTPRCSSA